MITATAASELEYFANLSFAQLTLCLYQQLCFSFRVQVANRKRDR